MICKTLFLIAACMFLSLCAGTRTVKSQKFGIPVNTQFIENGTHFKNRNEKTLSSCATVCAHEENCFSASYKAESHQSDCSSLPPDSYSGVYTIQTDTGINIDVFCEMEIDKGGWTVIQRRVDGSIDFFRYWHDYKTGFGHVAGEHWLGNDHIYAITQQRSYKARFDLEDFEGRTRFAIYTTFSIGNGGTNYTLSLKGYSGNAGDAIKPERTKARINGMMFSTRDRDNDPPTTKHCAVKNQGGWWFNQCTQANINGIYGMNVTDETNINWKTWQDDTPLKQTRMMIKPN